jgi:adenylate cyclase
MAETRKLAAILAADVVGFSRLAGAEEDLTLARLRALRSDLIDPIISVHRGRVVKRTGDGAIVEFRSVVDAVRCAVEVQDGMAVRNSGVPADRQIRFRIGIHVGDVMVESDGDLMGDGVNIAARLEGIAEPGGICLSSAAYEQVRDKVAADFVDWGERELKNIARPVRVYAISAEFDSTPANAGVHSSDVRTSTTVDPGFRRGGKKMEESENLALALPDKPSIAVLPFQNISGDAEQEYFCDGMVEDIITSLARINWLFVIARNSSFAYKGKSPDIRRVGRELGVRYVLEGSVRKAGNRVRVTGQLIEAETGTHLWADKFDGALEDIFDLQDRITDSVIGVIEPNLQRAEIERARRKPPEHLGAYDLYLRALPHIVTLVPQEVEIGIGFLERALEFDPQYAVAHAYLAWGLNSRFTRGGFDSRDRDAGLGHARSAVAHGGGDATALAIASAPLLHLGGDFAAAADAIARAVSLNHSCAIAFYHGAYIHGASGDIATAEDYANRALRFSPFDANAATAYVAPGFVRMRQRRFDDAALSFGKIVQMNPRFSTGYAHQAAALAVAGRVEEARTLGRRLLELQPGFRIEEVIAFARGFVHPDLVEAQAAGMRRAGLPE